MIPTRQDCTLVGRNSTQCWNILCSFGLNSTQRLLIESTKSLWLLLDRTVSLVGCWRLPLKSRRRRVFIMVRVGCGKFDADRCRISVQRVYARTKEMFVFTVSPCFVNRIVRAQYNPDDIDWEHEEPSSTIAWSNGVVGWLLTVDWKPSSAGFGHFGQR